jgi:hypothetical protein
MLTVSEAISQLKWVWIRQKSVPKRPLLSIQAYDSASRGPLGSLLLLFNRGGRSLVSLGAIILVLMLAFDPFAQQILNYRSRVRAVEGESSGAAVRQSRYGPLFLQIYHREVPAYHRGLWTNDFEVQPLCPSGNCTWPTFNSLGLCSTCTDMTSDETLICEQPTEDELVKPCRAEIPGGGTSNTTIRARAPGHEIPPCFLCRGMPSGRFPARG